MKEKNIGIATLDIVCEYLYLERLKITSPISDLKKELFDSTIEKEGFTEWLEKKLDLERLEIANARTLARYLHYTSTTEINDVLAERILNAVLFLIKKRFIPLHVKDSINLIIQSDTPLPDKINRLKSSEPFAKPIEKSKPVKPKKLYFRNLHNHDPYENFQWGGLRGEEAYIGFWNTD